MHAELIALYVAQAIMEIPSDGRFLAVAHKRLCHLFPKLAGRPGYHKRRRRLSDQIEALIDAFARECPAIGTPWSCWTPRRWSAGTRVRPPSARRLPMRPARLLPKPLALLLEDAPAQRLRPRRHPQGGDSLVALDLLPRALRGGEVVLGDKGYASTDFEAAVGEMNALLCRPRRRDEPGRGPQLAARIRQRIESVYQSLKDILTLERHGARTLERCGCASLNVCWRWLHASTSTTGSGARAARSSPTWPEAWN